MGNIQAARLFGPERLLGTQEYVRIGLKYDYNWIDVQFKGFLLLKIDTQKVKHMFSLFNKIF